MNSKHIKLIAVSVVALIIIGGGISFAMSRAKKVTQLGNNAADQKVAPMLTEGATGTDTIRESCSPPNTPTCGPDGKVVSGANPTQADGGATGTTSTVATLSDVGLKNISLTGRYPEGIDVDAKTGYVYIGNNSTVISGCKGDTSGPHGTGPSTSGAQEKGSNSLSIVDPASGKELANVASEGGAIWTLVDNSRNVVYLAGSGSGKIAVHELGTGVKKSTVTVGGKPHAFGLDTSTGVMIVSNTNDSTQTYMSALTSSTMKLLSHHKAPEFPHGISVDQDKDIAYMVGVKTGQIAVVDMKTGAVTSTFETSANNSNMMAYSPKLERIFISDTQTGSSITAIDAKTQKVLGKIAFSQKNLPAWGMQVDDTNGLLYAALPNGNAVGVADISSLKPLGLITVDECPYAVKLDLERGMGYTTNQVPHTMSMFDLKKVLAQIKK